MPDLPNRLQREEELGAALLMTWKPYQLQIEGGNEVDWDKHQRETQEALIGVLLLTWRDAAFSLYGSLGLTVDSDYLTTAGRRWVEPYTRKVSDELTRHTRERVEQARTNAAGDPKQLRTELDIPFGDARRFNIIITETTKAITAGERTAAEEINRTRQETPVEPPKPGEPPKVPEPLIKPYWITERDALVCPICAPLDGTPEEQWPEPFRDGPSAHPRCRCWLEWRAVAPTSESLTEAYEESEHPRDDHGRWIDKDEIAAAKVSTGKADELRARVTDPAERQKLDKAIREQGGTATKTLELPALLRDALGSSVGVKVVDTLKEAGLPPHTDGGYGAFDVKSGAIYVAEYRETRKGRVKNEDQEETLYHEAGHAIDSRLGHVSLQQGSVFAHGQDVRDIESDDRQWADKHYGFIQREAPMAGSQETFAQSFSFLLGGPDSRIHGISRGEWERRFPNTMRLAKYYLSLKKQ